ncbi:MAG: cob(I)yrinic acid a,c-diamide adenosyltransferase [Candidatus Methylomirabilales bacterium]
MVKIYTRAGDDGTTGLLFGGRVAKDDPRTEACGGVDEAVAVLGLARALGPAASSFDRLLLDLQRRLFVLGAELSTAPENTTKLRAGVSKVTQDMVAGLETEIDRLTAAAPLPAHFIVPGACSVSAALDVARAVVRRTERSVVTMQRGGLLVDPVVLSYLNRLSDLLFVTARFEEHCRGLQAPPSREL